MSKTIPLLLTALPLTVRKCGHWKLAPKLLNNHLFSNYTDFPFHSTSLYESCYYKRISTININPWFDLRLWNSSQSCCWRKVFNTSWSIMFSTKGMCYNTSLVMRVTLSHSITAGAFPRSFGFVSPFQALQLVERKVEDVSHVVIGAPGGHHLVLQGEHH